MSPARILFVIPYGREGSQWIPAGRKFPELMQFQPMGIPILAALTPDTFDLVFFNEYRDPLPSPLPDDCQIVALSFVTANSRRAFDLGDRFRSMGKTVVMGGPHATALPREAKAHADAVFIGEAELTWPSFLKDFAGGTVQDFYRQDEPTPASAIPRPRWDIMPAGSTLSLFTTRGCPFDCFFCEVSRMFGTTLRQRPVEQVIAEIEADFAAAGRKKHLLIKDDNIAIDRGYARELFQALEPLKVKFWAQGNARAFDDPELLHAAAQAGCSFITLGLETVNRQVLQRLRKNFTEEERTRRVIEEMHRYNISVLGSFVFGLDEDDSGTFDRTNDFARRLNLDIVIYNLLCPFPGTELYGTLSDAGRILDRNWNHYDIEHVVFEPKQMSAETLYRERRRVYRRFYTYPAIARRLVRTLVRSLRTGRYVPLRYHVMLNLMFRTIARGYGAAYQAGETAPGEEAGAG